MFWRSPLRQASIPEDRFCVWLSRTAITLLRLNHSGRGRLRQSCFTGRLWQTPRDMNQNPNRRQMRWWIPVTLIVLGGGSAAYCWFSEVTFVEPILIGIGLLTGLLLRLLLVQRSYLRGTNTDWHWSVDGALTRPLVCVLHRAAVANPRHPRPDHRLRSCRPLFRREGVDAGRRIDRRFRPSATGLEMGAQARRTGKSVDTGTAGPVLQSTDRNGPVAGG
jgi:hypothetical protein